MKPSMTTLLALSVLLLAPLGLMAVSSAQDAHQHDTQASPEDLEAQIAELRALVMRLGRYRMDFPRLLGIELSVDGREWELVRGGPTDTEAFVASFEDPTSTPLTFPLDGRPARDIRLRQMGDDETFYWSVAEIEVRRVVD